MKKKNLKTGKRAPKLKRGDQSRIVRDATTRLLLAVCLRVLAEAQRAVADGKWCERGMDVKINRIICPQYFQKRKHPTALPNR